MPDSAKQADSWTPACSLSIMAGVSRQTTWKTFLKSHWDMLAAAGSTTVEVWTRTGLVTFYLFLAIHLKSHRMELAGVTTSPDSAWKQQIARNLTIAGDGFLSESRCLILDRE